MKKNLISMVIPAFNEASKIKNIVAEVSKYVDLIVVVDDGSNDLTTFQAKQKKVILLRHSVNLGQGAALQTGFDYLKEIKPKVIITYDADGQFLATEIPQMIAPVMRGEVDISLGSRFLGTTISMPLFRRYLLKLGVFFTWIISEIKLTDTHNGFRAFNLKTLNLIKIRQNRMAHASEIIDQIKIHNLSYTEIPVTVKYDQYSKKKGQKNLGFIKILLDLISKKIN